MHRKQALIKSEASLAKSLYRNTMKWKSLFTFLLLCCKTQARVANFDYFYPEYDVIADYLDSIDSPVAETTNLGVANDGRQIVAIKFSDNPHAHQDKLGFLFVGVIHGRERLGVQSEILSSAIGVELIVFRVYYCSRCQNSYLLVR